ncbi:putative odorant receptor 69a [Anastrepha obliqua]|uniref:putative odorant receptor 69a n=1 Tax=Anastrepha obliqua TaxID=95512 RepID=UPI00240A09FC|nr:putative odorant receptor 69a [Anastrepha obliqua]
MTFRIYKLQNFLEYPELAFKWAFFEPFVWSGNQHRQQPTYGLQMKRLIYIFITSTLVAQVLALFFNLYVTHNSLETESNESGESDLFEALALMCFFSSGLYKMWNIFWRRDDIGRVLEELKELFPSATIQTKLAEANDYKTELKRGTGGYYRFTYYDQKSRTLMGRLARYFAFAYTYYNLVPVVQLIYEMFSPNQSITYTAQTNAWYPFHNQNKHSTFIGFVMSFLVQSAAEYAGAGFVMCGIFLVLFLTTQMKLHFDYLASALETLDASAPDALKQLKTLINYHNHLLRLCKDINDIFNFTFTLDLIVATIAISLMGLTMIMISFSRAVMYSAGVSFFLINTYVFCKNGDELTTVTQKLSTALYYSNWYEGTVEYRRMIIFFIMRTNRPCEYQAYGYTVISMETYMRILKLSYQLFTAFGALD